MTNRAFYNAQFSKLISAIYWMVIQEWQAMGSAERDPKIWWSVSIRKNVIISHFTYWELIISGNTNALSPQLITKL